MSLPRVPGAPRVRAGPSHRHARRAAGDRGPWVSLPLRATIPEGNTVGQHADVDVGPSHRAPGLRARGHRRIDAGDIDAGETSAHRIEGEADPLLVVTEECLARRGCGPARAIVTPDAPPAIAARGSACP